MLSFVCHLICTVNSKHSELQSTVTSLETWEKLIKVPLVSDMQCILAFSLLTIVHVNMVPSLLHFVSLLTSHNEFRTSDGTEWHSESRCYCCWLGLFLLFLGICFTCQFRSPKPFGDVFWKYPVISAVLERVNQNPFWGKYWLCILAYSEVANQVQLQNSGSPNNKASVFILSDETAIWHLQLPHKMGPDWWA